jgi:hypothetical protein
MVHQHAPQNRDLLGAGNEKAKTRYPPEQSGSGVGSPENSRDMHEQRLRYPIRPQ